MYGGSLFLWVLGRGLGEIEFCFCDFFLGGEFYFVRCGGGFYGGDC